VALVDKKASGDENDLSFDESAEENDQISVLDEVLKERR